VLTQKSVHPVARRRGCVRKRSTQKTYKQTQRNGRAVEENLGGFCVMATSLALASLLKIKLLHDPTI
jgi:hypothetical protein